jgi:hypothetical protein
MCTLGGGLQWAALHPSSLRIQALTSGCCLQWGAGLRVASLEIYVNEGRFYFTSYTASSMIRSVFNGLKGAPDAFLADCRARHHT